MKPDFAKACIRANDILRAHFTPPLFPLPLSRICEHVYGIPCLSYSYLRDRGLEPTKLGSKSSLLIEEKHTNRRVVFIDECKCKEHRYFSNGHELGHHVMVHKLTNLDPETYKIYEKEANYFAAQLTMPHQIIRLIKASGYKLTPLLIARVFDVSIQAAEIRIDNYAFLKPDDWTPEETRYDNYIAFKFAPFIGKYLNSKNVLQIARSTYSEEVLNSYFAEENYLPQYLWNYE